MQEGTFDWMPNRRSALAVETAYRAVSSVQNGWKYLEMYEPPEDQGFMFVEPDATLQEINSAIRERYDDHTLFTYGWTMRQMMHIAKNGWQDWVTDVQSWPDESRSEEKEQHEPM